MANYNLSLPAETIDELLLWLDDKQGIIIKQTDLLSGTGQSTTATMTQKAITDALGTKADSSNVYTKTQTDNLLNAKADKSTTYTKTETDTLLNGKVDKEAGKGLSTNDYTDADKTKLGALPTAAELDSELAVLAGEAGLAEAVIDTDGAGTEQEFTFRKSGGDGGAFYRKILGRSLVWNQTINYISPVIGGDTVNLSCTRMPSGAYKIVVANPVTQLSQVTFANLLINGYIAGRIYARIMNASSNLVPYLGYNGGNGVWWQDRESGLSAGDNLFQPATTMDALGTIYIGSTLPAGTYYVCPLRIDLTKEFGAGNEPATVADLKKLFYLPYYAHEPGRLIHNATTKIKTFGFNQWDEQWETGSINPSNGVNMGDPGNIRSKGYIPVKGGEEYYLSPTLYVVCCYDADKNFLRRAKYTTAPLVVQLGQDVAFLRFTTYDYGSVYKNDICVNLSDPAKNGTYEPYWEREIALDLTTKKASDDTIPFPAGLKSAGTTPVYDEADQQGGVIRVGTRAYQAGDESDSTLTTDGTNTNYPLTTPVSFTWKEPLNLGIKVDEGGTEQALPEQTSTPTSAPFNAMTTYTMSVARMVEILKNL